MNAPDRIFAWENITGAWIDAQGETIRDGETEYRRADAPLTSAEESLRCPEVRALVGHLSEALRVIKDAAEYQHSGDPWEENAFDMGELDLHDFAKDGRLDAARKALAAFPKETK
jgi:hypothetical protein